MYHAVDYHKKIKMKPSFMMNWTGILYKIDTLECTLYSNCNNRNKKIFLKYKIHATLDAMFTFLNELKTI